MIWLATITALTAGYAIGRIKPLHRALDWANWQRYGRRPTGLRYAAVFTLLSVENLTWLIIHPVQGWHAWKHRNDPPPPLSPALTFNRIRTHTVDEEA